MQSLILFFKGIVVGIGKIIPGVSGSMLATLLHIYEDSIYAINHIKEDVRKSIFYLFPIGCGVFLAVLFFSNIVFFFLNHFYVFTMFFFLGLILGTVPHFRKTLVFESHRDILFFLLGFLLPFCFSIFQMHQEFIPTLTFFSFLFIIFLGFIDAFSMVIPGISGTALFLMLNSYSFVLNILGNPFGNLFYCGLFGLGLGLGVLITSHMVEYCFQKNKNRFLVFIYGLLWNSIIYLFSLVIFQVNMTLFIPVCCLLGLGFFLSLSFS